MPKYAVCTRTSVIYYAKENNLRRHTTNVETFDPSAVLYEKGENLAKC